MAGSERGFTIIEVVLFLAITGGLFAALMIGVSVGVTQQRYLDSVRSYKALLQDQYIAAINTRNEANQNVKCGDAGDGSIVESQQSGGAGGRDPARGASECVILGRAIQIQQDSGSTRITTSSVTGYEPVGTSDDTSDSNVISSYQPKLALYDREESTIAWGGSLTQADRQDQQDLSTALIVVLRSPKSGSIVVYTTNNGLSGEDLTPLFADNGLRDAAVVKSCVDGDSGLLPKQMIVIDPNISGPDAVSSDGGRNEVCQR